MNKEKEEILEKLRNVKQTAENDLKNNHPGYENYEVRNVIHYNKKVELVSKKTKQVEKFDLCVAEVQDPETKQTMQMYYLNGEEIDFTELMMEYESPEPIKDVVDKTKENEEKPEEEQDKELKKEELNNLEKEEIKGKEKSKEKNGEKKKRKPSYVIERVNPDKAKFDYWQTIKQGFGLPPEVDTLAFSYPVSSEDKVNYANITIYMLDKNGYIIDDLDVDDYFEFDSSTGNNPINDETVRHEEDENKGKAQIYENNTMIRLKAKNNSNQNTYISLEQKNSIGDYNDINAGRKVVGGTQNVEKQLETDHVRVWDAEREKLVKSNAGLYNINEIFDEAEKHREHGDEEYIDSENADGDSNTATLCKGEIVPGTNTTWQEFANMCGYRGDDALERAQEKFLDYQKKHPDMENDEIINGIEEDIEQEMPGPNKDRR